MDICFFDTFFGQQIIGFIIGLITGILLHILKQHFDQSKGRKSSINKLLQSLPITLNTFNQIMNEVKGPNEGRITTEIDLSILDKITSQNYEIFKSNIDNRKIYELRDSLNYLNNLINQFLLYHEKGGLEKPAFIDKYRNTKQLILEQEDRIRNQLIDLISLIGK